MTEFQEMTIGHLENLAAYLRQNGEYDPKLTVYAAALIAKGLREAEVVSPSKQKTRGG